MLVELTKAQIAQMKPLLREVSDRFAGGTSAAILAQVDQSGYMRVVLVNQEQAEAIQKVSGISAEAVAKAKRQMEILRKQLPQPTPAQGLRFESVERDGEIWGVEFTAGEYRYQYTARPNGDLLTLLMIDGEWKKIAGGSDAAEMILDNVGRMAGLSLDWPTFRFGYEHFYNGYAAGRQIGDEAHIIPAAPDLSEAAKAALDLFNAYIDDQVEGVRKIEEIAAQLDAAIAAADPEFVC